MAQYFSAFAQVKMTTPASVVAAESASTNPRLERHREKTRRICELHDAVDVVGWLDRAGRAQRALVGRGSPGLEQHRHESDGHEDCE